MSLAFKMEQLDKIVNRAILIASAVCETELRDAMTEFNSKTDVPEDADAIHIIMQKKSLDDDIASERKRQRLAAKTSETGS